MVEQFSKNIIASRIFHTYVAAVFFGSLIFFILNAHFFTPIEIITGVILITIAFKGISNIMLSMTISLINLENQQDKVEFEEAANRLESLVNDLAIKEAAVQTSKNNNEIKK